MAKIKTADQLIDRDEYEYGATPVGTEPEHIGEERKPMPNYGGLPKKETPKPGTPEFEALPESVKGEIRVKEDESAKITPDIVSQVNKPVDGKISTPDTEAAERARNLEIKSGVQPHTVDYWRQELLADYNKRVEVPTYAEDFKAGQVGTVKKPAELKAGPVEQVTEQEVKDFDEKHIQLLDGKWMLRADWDKLSTKYKNVALSSGFDGMNRAILADNKKAKLEAVQASNDAAEFEVRLLNNSPELYKIYKVGGVDAYNKEVDRLEAKYQEAEKKLVDFKDEGGNYDIVGYLKKNPGKEQTLLDAGFKKKDVEVAAETSKLNIAQSMWRSMTPWDESAKESVTAKGAGVMAAELLVPGVYVARNWNDLSVGERALNIAIDVASLIPFAGAAVRGARVAASVGRAAMLAGAAKGALKEAVVQARAPIDVIIHPAGTAKATFSQARNLVENIAHPKKIPEVVITTSESTVRLKVTSTTGPEEAMAIRDTLMEAAARGEHPVVQIGDQTVELATSPLMRETGGGLAHATPMGEAFEAGTKVTAKPGMPASEQGLFMSNEPLPRFAESSAFGKTGEKPAFIIVSKETASKAVTSGKIYKSPVGAVVEMERKFEVGADIPAPKQRLFTRVGSSAQRVEIWLEKPLSPRQIAKLKAEGLIETIKAPFKPAITVKGEGRIAGLTEAETKQLARTLKSAGNVDEARNLVRAERLARNARVTAPALSRVTGRVSPDRIQAARERLGVRETGRASPERLERIERTRGRVTRAERAERLERVSRTERTERQERLTRDQRVGRSESLERNARERGREGTERLPRSERERLERERVKRGRESLPTPEIGKRPEPILVSGKKQDAGIKLTKAEIDSAVAWPQGMGYWVVYRNREDVLQRRFIHGQKPPRGVKMVKPGEGEAYRGIQLFKGKGPAEFEFDMGINKVRVERPLKKPGKLGAIGYAPAISDRQPFISQRVRLPRSSRGIRITPKRPRLPR